MNIIKINIKPNIYLNNFNNYIISGINLLNINCNGLNKIKNSFNMLQIDKYHNINPPTRLRKYFNLDIDMKNDYEYIIKYNHDINVFKQQVEDNRNIPRKFALIDYQILYSQFMISYICQISSIVKNIENINRLNISIHQVRQICYPNIISENAPEGIHQDGADYIVSALVINHNNVKGGVSKIYDLDKNILESVILKENKFIFQNDKTLYHYITPIKCYDDNYLGFRDIIGLDINIID
tara:strand:+ start:474 stop:1190 length:717 start_codon:yes stop_codon:yes gene_type:complete